MSYSLNLHGRLVDLDHPCVMGILNVTPDSFFAESRTQTEQQLRERVAQIIAEGGTMIDIGACSTRPGSQPVSEEEEMARLRWAFPIIRTAISESPNAYIPLSLDTFRPSVARMAVEEFGIDIINDVSEGDHEMFRMVARLGVPYVLMSVQPDLRQTLLVFAQKIQQLRDYGQKDIILDPGFGFGKTLNQNFELLNDLDKLRVFDLPLLVGVSRKSMIYKTLGCTPEEALNGTTVLNTIALMKGATILRVHDVRQAVECCRLSPLS
jgi:dihydropteroate synthase